MAFRLSLVGAIAAAFSTPLSAQVQGPTTRGGCIDVAEREGPVTVSVSGTLTTMRFSNPWQSGTAYIIELATPICLDDGGDFANPAERVNRVHISSGEDALMSVLRASVGRRVTIVGEGFASHTAHHQAPLVVLASRISVE